MDAHAATTAAVHNIHGTVIQTGFVWDKNSWHSFPLFTDRRRRRRRRRPRLAMDAARFWLLRRRGGVHKIIILLLLLLLLLLTDEKKRRRGYETDNVILFYFPLADISGRVWWCDDAPRSRAGIRWGTAHVNDTWCGCCARL